MVEPVQAIQQNTAGRLSGPGLLRALAGFDRWVLPGGPEPLVIEREGERWLPMFTDHAALLRYQASSGLDLGELWLQCPGPGLFAGLGEELAGVDMDPGSEHAVHYRQEQLPLLRRWGRSLQVERLLLGQEEHPLSLLREHDGYHLLMRATADGHSQLVLAPDARGRQLAAVFTAEDCLQAFMDRVLTQVKPLPLSLMLSGQELFERLVAMPLQGIVFNCAGPVQPQAVQLELARQVLQA